MVSEVHLFGMILMIFIDLFTDETFCIGMILTLV